ncbi:MAG: hypothetical protein NHB14_21875 [Desulfosporosinus sp.]|nr:hypothetical protein [Desulfosporosinus sp.]
MTKRIHRPILLIVGHKSSVWFMGFIGLVAILGILGLKLMVSEPHAYIPEQASLPVNSQMEKSLIQFEVETLKSNSSGGTISLIIA